MPEFEYPAAVSVLVAGVGLIDNLHDAPSIQSKVHLAVLRSRIREAEQDLRELGLKLPSLASLVEEQHRREAVVGRELAYYSGTTEEMYSKIFSHTATLAGAPCNTAHLAEVGRHVGRVAYLLDNYVDFQKDKREGCFNVFDNLSSSGASSENPKQLVASYVNHSLQCIRDNILKVTLRRFQRTIRYTVTEGLCAKVRKAITNPEITALRPFAYSMLPMAIGLALHGLQSSSGSDCCDCTPSCDPGALCAAYIQQSIASTATQTLYGAGAAAIGGASAVAVSAIASHLHAGSTSPTEDAPNVSVDVEETQSIRTIAQSNADEGPPPESPIATTQMPSPLDTDDPIEGLRRTWDYLTRLLRQGSEAGKGTEDWAQQQGPPEQPGQGPTLSDSVNRAQDLLNQGREATSPSHDDAAAKAIQDVNERTGAAFGSDGMVKRAAQSPDGISDGDAKGIMEQVQREEIAEKGKEAVKLWALGATVAPKVPEALNVQPGETPAAAALTPSSDGHPPVVSFTPAQPTGEAGARAANIAAEGVTHHAQIQTNPVEAYTGGVFQKSDAAHGAMKQFRDTYQHDPNPNDFTDLANYRYLLNQALGKSPSPE